MKSAAVSDPLRIAVVGAGLMGEWHAEAAARAGGQVMRVIDLDIGRARHLARRYRHCEASTSLNFSGSERVDVVHICTPTQTHEPMAILALRHRMHVLVEKPLAETAPATRRLFDLAASQHVLLCPVHQFLFQRGLRKAVALLPHVAPIRHVAVATCSAGAVGQSDDVRDAIAIDIVPHFVSLVARLWPTALTGEWDMRRADAGELMMTTSVEGASVSLVISMGGRPACNWLRIVGEGGTIDVDLFHGFAVRHSPAVSRRRKIVQPFAQSYAVSRAAAVNLIVRALRRNGAYPGLRELVQLFYGAIRAGQQSPIAPQETVAVAVLRDRMLAHMTQGASR